MVHVSTKVKVGEAVSSLGQFIEYLYGKDDTTEEHCPSKKLAEKKGNGMPTPTAQYARNVNVVIQCHECEKWTAICKECSYSLGENKARKDPRSPIFLW